MKILELLRKTQPEIPAEYISPSRNVIENHQTALEGLVGDFKPISPLVEFPEGNFYSSKRYKSGNWFVSVAMLEGTHPESGNVSTFTSVTFKRTEPSLVSDSKPKYTVFQLNTIDKPGGHLAYAREFSEPFADTHTDDVPLFRLFIPKERVEVTRKIDDVEELDTDQAYEVMKGQFATEHDINEINAVLSRVKPEDALDASGRTLRERTDFQMDAVRIEHELRRLVLLARTEGIANPYWTTKDGREVEVYMGKKDKENNEERNIVDLTGGRVRRIRDNMTIRRGDIDTFAFKITDPVYTTQEDEPLQLSRVFNLESHPKYGRRLTIQYVGEESTSRWMVGSEQRKGLISLLSALQGKTLSSREQPPVEVA